MERLGLRVNTPHVIHETIDGEVVVINLASGNYYSMKGAGADVWEVIQSSPGADASGIAAAVAHRFDEPGDSIEPEIAAFLERLREEELLTAVDNGGVAAVAASNGAPSGDGRKFEPPLLEKYADLQDLILLDPVHDVSDAGWPQRAADASV